MKKIKLPIQNTFSLSFSTDELSKKEKIRMPDGSIAVNIGKIVINNNHPDLLQAMENGSQIIWGTINIELMMEDIITKYLFGMGIGINERLDFFNNEIITSNNISFSFKKKLVLKLIKSKNLISKKKYSELDNKLVKVMTYRNAFAHGNLVIDNEYGCLLEFYSGYKQKFILNDSFWNELTAIFKTVNDSLSGAAKKLSNINLKRQKEDQKNYKREKF